MLDLAKEDVRKAVEDATSAEGLRYTTAKDFALLCPTCHRVEHARIRAAAKEVSA